VGARRFLALWALEWAWQPAEVLSQNLKNLHAESQLSSFYSFRDLSVYTDGQTDRRTNWVGNASFYLLHTFRQI